MTSTNRGDSYLCWHEIGINGNRSCKHLSEYVHCRNCPEYSAIGRTLLNREMPDEYRQEVSTELASASTIEAAESDSMLLFRTGSEWFGMRTLVFQEITAWQKPYALPFRSGGLLAGLVNVNGELLLCIGLQAALGLSPDEKANPDGRARLCVVGNGHERYAFAVDEILGVRRIPCSRLQPVPVTLAKSPSMQITSCFESDDRSIGLIDEQRLLNSLDRRLRW